MKIQFTNRTTTSAVHPDDFATFVAAFALQVKEDYCPGWDIAMPAIICGGAIIAEAFQLGLFDTSDAPGALGYHDKDKQGKPYGSIFVETSIQDGEDWRVTASHEGLETLGDRYCATWVQAGDGRLRAFEMCDACQADSYMKSVGGESVRVSNFLLPAYFSDATIVGARSDFLNELRGAPAPAMTPGGYDIVIDTQGNATQEFARLKGIFASMKPGKRARKEGPYSRSTRRLRQAARMLGVTP